MTPRQPAHYDGLDLHSMVKPHQPPANTIGVRHCSGLTTRTGRNLLTALVDGGEIPAVCDGTSSRHCRDTGTMRTPPSRQSKPVHESTATEQQLDSTAPGRTWIAVSDFGHGTDQNRSAHDEDRGHRVAREQVLIADKAQPT